MEVTYLCPPLAERESSPQVWSCPPELQPKPPPAPAPAPAGDALGLLGGYASSGDEDG